MSEDPFDRLFADQEPLDRELLAETIYPYVRLYGDPADILPKKQWDSLNLQGKILTYLLARKVMELREIKRRGEVIQQAATSKEIEADTGLKGNSIRPILSKLLEAKLVRRIEGDDGIRHFVPDYVIQEISSVLSGSGE